MTTTTQHATGTFCWFELGTTDQDGAKKFYSGLFGWKPDDTPTGDGQTYTMLRHNGREIGALYPQPKEQREQGVLPNWMPYILMESADQTVAKIKQSGGKVLKEPFDVMEYGRMAVCQDPTGGTFSVWQAKQHSGAGVVNETGAVCWNELITNDSPKA